MIRSLIAAMVMVSASSFAFASQNACDSNLVLSCEATSAGKGLAAGAANFADENEDEPSLANCAATAYITIEKSGPTEVAGTVVRIYASKDLSSNRVDLTSTAIQIEDTVNSNGEITRNAYYSNTAEATTVVGGLSKLGTLRLNKSVVLNGTPISDLQVTCTVR